MRQRLRALGRRLQRTVPRPGLNDIVELAGVVLVAWALTWVHEALAPGALGLYAIVTANR